MGRHIAHEPLMEEDNNFKNTNNIYQHSTILCNNNEIEEEEERDNNDSNNNNGVILYADGIEMKNIELNNTSVTYIKYNNKTQNNKTQNSKETTNTTTNNTIIITEEQDNTTTKENEIEEIIEEMKPANTGVLPWLSLFLLVLCPLGGYVAYDVPGALNISFKESAGLSLTQIGALYTAYAIPTVITSPFCGIIAQMFKGQRCVLVCNILLALGSLGFSFASSFPVMLASRVLFGLGAEILFVSVYLLIEEWFRHSKYMSVAFGACSCFPLLGTIVSFAALPPVSNGWNLRGALLVATGFCFFSVLASVTYSMFLHPRMKHSEKSKQEQETKVTAATLVQLVKSIRVEFWLLCIFVFALYTTGFSFLAVAGRYFNEVYGYSDVHSSWLVCVFCAVAVVFGPLMTYILDKFKRRISVGIVMAILNSSIYVIFAFTKINPIILLVVSAVVFVIGSSIVFSLASMMAAHEKEIGLLFSIISVFQNFTFLTMPVMFGALRDATGGFMWSCMSFAFISFLGVIAMVAIKYRKAGLLLDAPPSERVPLTRSSSVVSDDGDNDVVGDNSKISAA